MSCARVLAVADPSTREHVTFSEQLLLTFVDTAAIGMIVAAAAFGLNRALERFKFDRQHELEAFKAS